MTFVEQLVSDAVDRHFQLPNAARAARKQVFIVAGTVLLFLAARSTSGYLAAALAVWVVWRVFLLFLLVTVGARVADELTRRLNALPTAVRQILAGGAR